MRVLFVCHGNICRSPMAEFILKALVRSRRQEGAWHIESAAVSTEEIGNPIYPPAKRCLSQHGVPFDKEKRARQVTRADYDRFDRIICMDAWNLRLIKRIISDDPDAKEVTVDGEAVDLSIHEYNLLKLFLENVGDTFTAEDLHKQCWSENTATNVRVVDTYINRLRRKIGPYAENVITKEGEGYCFQ